MKFVTVPCSNKNCVCYSEAWRNGRIIHKILGAGSANTQILSCDVCGSTSWRDAPQVTMSIKKRSWPYENQSTGTVFESEAHEKAYVKQHKLEAI